jgi:hypothetical protein
MLPLPDSRRHGRGPLRGRVTAAAVHRSKDRSPSGLPERRLVQMFLNRLRKFSSALGGDVIR